MFSFCWVLALMAPEAVAFEVSSPVLAGIEGSETGFRIDINSVDWNTDNAEQKEECRTLNPSMEVNSTFKFGWNVRSQSAVDGDDFVILLDGAPPEQPWLIQCSQRDPVYDPYRFSRLSVRFLSDSKIEALEKAELEFFDIETSQVLATVPIEVIDEIPADPSPGYLSHVAGGDYTGIDRPAILYHLADPVQKMGLDSDGRIYFLEGNQVRRIESDGTLATVVELSGWNLFVVKNNYLYYKHNERFFRIDVNTLETELFAVFRPPTEFATGGFDVDSKGNIYHLWGYRLYKIDAETGQTVHFAGSGETQPSEEPEGIPALEAYISPGGDIAVDPRNDTVLVGDRERIRRIDPRSGLVHKVISRSSAEHRWGGFSVSNNGDLIIIVNHLEPISGGYGFRYYIYRFSERKGLSLVACNGWGPGRDQDHASSLREEEGVSPLDVGCSPLSILTDASGENFYFSESHIWTPNRIRRVDLAKDTISTVLGFPGFLGCTSSTESRLEVIEQMDTDANGVLYAMLGNAIVAINPEIQSIYTVAGIFGVNGIAEEGESAFGNPMRVQTFAVAPNGDLFIDEFGRLLRVRRDRGVYEGLGHVTGGHLKSLQYHQNGYLYGYVISRPPDRTQSQMKFVRIDPDTGRTVTLVQGGRELPELGKSAEGRKFWSDDCNWYKVCDLPLDMAVDSKGNIYISTTRADAVEFPLGIYRIDAETKVLSSVVGTQRFGSSDALGIQSNIALDEVNGLIYFIHGGKVIKADLASGEVAAIAGGSESAARFPTNPLGAKLAPNSLHQAASGELFIGDRNSPPAIVRISAERPLGGSSIPDDITGVARVGKSVASEGQWLAIGVPEHRLPDGAYGEVLMYQDNDCQITMQDRLRAPAGDAAFRFGHQLAFVGDSLIVGASAGSAGSKNIRSSTQSSQSFRLGVFKREGSRWRFSRDLSGMLPSIQEGSKETLAAHGATFAIGSPGAGGGRGAVTVFAGSGNGDAITIHPAGNDVLGFGKSIALNDQGLAVGSDTESGGNVELYQRAGQGYQYQGTVLGSRGNNRYAASLAMNDESLYVGAPHASGGRVYEYSIDDLNLNFTLTDPEDEDNSSFGGALAIENDLLVVGAPDAPVTTNQPSASTETESLIASGKFLAFGVKNSRRQRVSPFLLLSKQASFEEAYGDAVDISNSRILVGAPETDEGRGSFDLADDMIDPSRLSGLWYDPSLDGEGFNVLVADAGLVVFFYGYDRDGRRLWLVSDTIRKGFGFGEDIHVPLFKAQDGDFARPEPSSETLVTYGSLSITFGSARSATFTISGFDGNKISRTAFLADAGANGAVYSGLWYDPEYEGEGFNVISGEPGTVIFYYGNSRDGKRLWLISDLMTNNINDGATLSGQLYEATGGDFYHPAPSSSSLRKWGTIEARFDECSNGQFVLAGRDGNKTADVIKLAGVAGDDCR